MRPSRTYEDFPVTSFLLLFNIAFFFLEIIAHVKSVGEFPELLGVEGISSAVLQRLGWLSLRELRQGEYWRLLAAGFLHAGLLHLLLNGWVLFDVGRVCEPLLSSWKLLVVYTASLAGGSAGSAAYSWWSHRDRASVGASGAISGLVGLLLVFSVRNHHQEMRNALLRWVLLIGLFGVMVPQVDNAGHLGGFLVGCAFGFTVENYITSGQAARWKYPGRAAGALLAAALGLAAWNYFYSR